MTQTEPKTPRGDREEFQAASGDTMKAIVYTQYGSPDVLQLKEVEKPTPRDNEVLLKVYATSVNAGDLHVLRADPFLIRLMGYGLLKPKNKILGAAIAGRIEAIGGNVKQFQPGDDVFGDLSESGKRGGFAEYVCASADALVLKPSRLSFEEAAAVPVAAVTALQGLRDKGHIQAGQKVLINGASGGVGTFAVQIAKSLGAEVTGVCSTRNLDLVRSIGADHVIDYTKEDFTKSGQRYDVIFDNVQNHTFSERRRVLTPNGICVLAGLGGAGWHEDTWTHLVRSFTTPLMSKFTSQKFSFYISQLNHNDLAWLGDRMQSGKVTPVIDRNYKSLNDVRDALAYLEQGHAHGKVVISVE